MDGRIMALRVGFHSPVLQLAGLNFLSPALQKRSCLHLLTFRVVVFF